MKICYIDIETTGLNFQDNKVLQVAAVVDDLENPKPINELPIFNVLIRHTYAELFQDSHGESMGIDPYVLKINEKLFDNLKLLPKDDLTDSDGYKMDLVDRLNFTHAFTKYLEKSYAKTEKIKIHVGGKNVAAFDLRFIEQMLRWTATCKMKGSRLLLGSPLTSREVEISSRTLDVGSLYVRPNLDVIPSLQDCLDMAGIEHTVTHGAVSDCLACVKLVRKHFGLGF